MDTRQACRFTVAATLTSLLCLSRHERAKFVAMDTMKRLTAALVVGIAIVGTGMAQSGETRSARPQAVSRPTPPFDPQQSVAVFVGIRNFGDDETLEAVPYAVDDAVDLAYLFALDPRVALVRPKQVILALSDENPRKEISKRRLAELKRKGAIIAPATQSQILKLLNRQAGTVGPDGIFIVSFATHGFSNDGDHYLVATNSLLREPDTAIPAARVLDLVASSRAKRSLILIDTCRERVRRQRSTAPEPFSAAPLIQRMTGTAGQVVLYAAAAGQWSYDDDLRQNGVFTAAVIDALQCRAGHDESGMVTVNELSQMVERTVLSWIRINRDPTIRNATQANIDGSARMMPLAVCTRRPPVPPRPLAIDTAMAPQPNRRPIRPLVAQCSADGETLLRLYSSRQPDEFVRSYLRWRDGCVAVLRDLDSRLPQRSPEASETVRFLSKANFWCATKCPDTLSPGNCALLVETPRAERCAWDLHDAVKHIEDVLVRYPTALQTRESQ